VRSIADWRRDSSQPDFSAVPDLRPPARGIDCVTAFFESVGPESVMLIPIGSQPSPRAVCICDVAAARVLFFSVSVVSRNFGDTTLERFAGY